MRRLNVCSSTLIHCTEPTPVYKRGASCRFFVCTVFEALKIPMQWERLQTWKTLESQQESVHKRMYKGEVFNWEECVDLWGYHYEISKLYEWFVQLKKVE